MMEGDDRKEERRPGSLMIIIGWLLAIGTLFLFFNGVLNRQNNPNTAQVLAGQSGPVVLQANRNGMYHADGTINGYPVEFLLDTGATSVAVPDWIAREAGMPRGPAVRVSTANGDVVAWDSHIDSIQLGNLALQDVDALIIEDIGPGILLGMSALRGLEFSQVGGVLELWPAD